MFEKLCEQSFQAGAQQALADFGLSGRVKTSGKVWDAIFYNNDELLKKVTRSNKLDLAEVQRGYLADGNIAEAKRVSDLIYPDVKAARDLAEARVVALREGRNLELANSASAQALERTNYAEALRLAKSDHARELARDRTGLAGAINRNPLTTAAVGTGLAAGVGAAGYGLGHEPNWWE